MIARRPFSSATRAGAGSLAGTLLGRRFAVTALIGTGGTGEVYEARDVGGGGLVAVKVLHERLRADPDVVARFRREARSAAALTHPNSLLVLEAEQDDDGVPFLVMELLKGRDLARLLRELGALPAERAIRIACQVLAAVGEAHTRGIVHRDLKPGNVVLIERGGTPDFVKVCDYGLAKVVDTSGDAPSDGAPLSLGSETGRNVLSGTPEYMSPEQARGDTLDGRSDLYAVAVILYEMVTGRVPFRGTSALGVLTRHLTETPPPPSTVGAAREIPASLERLILRGLAKDLEARPSSAAAFRGELEEIAAALTAGGSRESEGARAAAMAMVGGKPDDALPAAASPSAATIRTHLRRWRRAAPIVVVAGLAAVALGSFARRPARVSAKMDPIAAPSITPRDPASPAMAMAMASPAAVVSADTLPVALPRGEARPARVPRRTPRATSDRAPARAELAQGESAPAAPAPVERALADPEHALSEGRRLMAEGHIGEACAQLESAKARHSSSPSIHKLLGQCYMRSRRIADAKLNFRRYLELAPDATDAAFIRSILD